MFTPRRLTAAGLVFGFLAALVFAADLPTGPALDRLYKSMDKNGDGMLTREEFGRPEMFNLLDRDRDGKITLAEAQLELTGKSGHTGPMPATPPPALESPRQGPKLLKAGDHQVGTLIGDLSFTGICGRTGKLSDFADRKALVIAFTSTTCPISKRYAPSLARIEKQFAGRGVAMLYVNPLAADETAEMKADIAAQGLIGPYIHDTAGAFARALGAMATTDVFVLDSKRTLIYRGAIDDQYGLGYNLDAPHHRYLTDALEALLAGRAPNIAATDAPGCALDQSKAPASSQSTPITYHNRISRIIQNHCRECHRRGGVAPFALETYEQVASRAATIKKVLDQGAMPPWFAAAPAQGHASPWSNDRSLAARDKADLMSWLNSSRPIGDMTDAPLPRAFPEGWAIGTPDQIYQLPKPIAIKAEGDMPYQLVTIDSKITEDRYVQAMEIQPTAREVVHHVLVFARHAPPAKSGKRQFNEIHAERDGYFAIYVPGNASMIYPEGFAKKLPADSRLIFQIHYTPSGKSVSDQLKLGVIFAKQSPRHVVQTIGLPNTRLNIPPNAADHTEKLSVPIPADAHVLAFLPHMHLRGKAFRYDVTLPDGNTHNLLDIPRYDFNWQLAYTLAEPMTLPAGSVIHTTAVFDNSAGNPANPDPGATVRWGRQTYEEMMLGYIEYYTDDNHSLDSSRRPRSKTE